MNSDPHTELLRASHVCNTSAGKEIPALPETRVLQVQWEESQTYKIGSDRRKHLKSNLSFHNCNRVLVCMPVYTHSGTHTYTHKHRGSQGKSLHQYFTETLVSLPHMQWTCDDHLHRWLRRVSPLSNQLPWNSKIAIKYCGQCYENSVNVASLPPNWKEHLVQEAEFIFTWPEQINESERSE